MQSHLMTADDYFERGNSKYSLNDFKGAIEDYSQAIKLNPNDADAYNNRGSSKHSLQDQIGAIKDYNLAIELQPKHAVAYFNRGASKHYFNNYEGAIEDYSQAIKRNSDYTTAYFNRGISKASLKDFKGAIEDFNRAIKLNQNYVMAYNNRGNSKHQLKDYQGALSDLLTAISLSPQPSPLAIFNLANLYLDMGMKDEALKRYIEGVKAFKRETEASLKIKFKLSDININNIKSSIQNFEELTKQVEEIKRQAQKQNRPEVQKNVKIIRESILAFCIKQIDQNANQTQIEKIKKTYDEQLNEMKMRLAIVQTKTNKLQRKVDKLKAQVIQMGKYIYAEKKILDKIDNIDSRKLSEFYKLLYSMLINQFMAYRMLSTGFFKENEREVTTFDKIAGKVSQAQPIIESIPIIGDLVGIPFKILGIVREEKNSHLNSVIMDKINESKLYTEAKITSYMSHTLEELIDNKAFNDQLMKSIQKEEESFINKAMDVFGTLKDQIYCKIFGGSSGKFSYVQQAVTVYMAKFTLQLYEVKGDKFEQHCKSEESFSAFFMQIFGGTPQKQPNTNKESNQVIGSSVALCKDDLSGNSSTIRPKPGTEPTFNSSTIAWKNDTEPTCWQRFVECCCCFFTSQK